MLSLFAPIILCVPARKRVHLLLVAYDSNGDSYLCFGCLHAGGQLEEQLYPQPVHRQDVANCWPISWPEFAKEKIQPRWVGQRRQTRYLVDQILAYFNRYELDGISAERKLYKIESLFLPKNEFARREAKPAAVPQAHRTRTAHFCATSATGPARSAIG